MNEGLASYAVSERTSRGRAHPERAHPYRGDFERDRDRIIHCSAFRRLEGKTQVFTPGLDDYYRTRLTHTIEVAQIGRTVARVLGLNENLTEAICLAHDLGHPPFGHTGEQVLNELTADCGGFEHNRQTLRVVDILEHPYPDFAGLNLMYETRLGLAKHRTPYDQAQQIGFNEQNCSLEGQVADIADRIAYNCHDLEDGLRAGIITDQQVADVELFAEARRRINAARIEDDGIRRTRIAKTIIDMLVSDCIDASKTRIRESAVSGPHEVCRLSEDLIALSEEKEAALARLESFLLENFYHHAALARVAEKVRRWLGELFRSLCRKSNLLPRYFRQLAAEQGIERAVCDYIAGMTDRFCLKSLEAITGRSAEDV